MRRYADPLVAADDQPVPTEFVWRARRYHVDAVIDQWTERGLWWRDLTRDRSIGYQVWRVQAHRVGGNSCGVFDLAHDLDQWRLVRCHD